MRFTLLATAVLFLLPGCTSFVYQPMNRLLFDPKLAGLIYEDIDFQSSDGLHLKGWFFPAQKLKPSLATGFWDNAKSVKTERARGTVVHFHGNGENRSSHFGTLAWILEYGYNLFIFDYRGYDGSEGTPEPSGVYRDGMAAIRWAKEHAPRGTDQQDLILYGQSMGGAVLGRCYEDVVDRSRVRAVVIESSFTSYQAIAADVLSRWWLSWPFQFLGYAFISDVTSPENSYAQISPTPLLVMHGRLDQVVPYRFGEKIFASAHEPKTFWEIPRGRHLNTYAVEQGRFQGELAKFLDDLSLASQKEKPSSNFKSVKRGK